MTSVAVHFDEEFYENPYIFDGFKLVTPAADGAAPSHQVQAMGYRRRPQRFCLLGREGTPGGCSLLFILQRDSCLPLHFLFTVYEVFFGDSP